MMKMEQMHRYVSPVNPAVYPHLTAVLLVIGVFYTAWFLVYEVTISKANKDLRKELALAAISAVFMGVGSLFLALTVGLSI